MNFISKTILLLLITFSHSQDCCEVEEIATANCGGLGCYIPQCTENCEWEPMQCWSSTGYCWCVDEFGDEIEGTSTPSWQGFPDCEEHDECIDGEIDDDDPCFISECFDGQWVDLIIDCPEQMGIPCEGGVYITPEEGECCSECILYGDINFDSSLNVLDVVALVNIVLTNSEYNILADLNLDNTINVLDVVFLINIILN